VIFLLNFPRFSTVGNGLSASYRFTIKVIIFQFHMGHTRRGNDVTYRDFGRRWQVTHQTTQNFLPERMSFLAQSEGLQGTTAHAKSIFICLAFFTPMRNFAAAAKTRVRWLPANCGAHQCRQGKDNRMLQTIRQLTAAALYSLLLVSFLHDRTYAARFETVNSSYRRANPSQLVPCLSV